MALKVAREALSDIRAANAWWKANRPAAPMLFTVEVEQALHLLVDQPSVGIAALDAAASGVRRLYLRSTRYFLYYSVQGEDIEVLRLWHSSRGTKPKL